MIVCDDSVAIMALGLRAALLNIVASGLLLIGLRFAVLFESTVVLVWKEGFGGDSVQLSFVNLENYVDRHVWNQILAAGGVLVGGLAFVAFRLHERHLRHSLDCRKSRGRGLSLLARPPTQRSNAGGGFWLDGASLFRLAVASILASTAAVSTLGMHLRPFSTGSPIPQQRTQDLRHIFYGQREGTPDIQVPSTDMAAIVYQSAFRRTVGATGDRSTFPGRSKPSAADYVIDSSPPRIGWANYQDLRTRGVGAYPARLADTYPWHLLAPGLTFHSLEGFTVGTNISAECQDETMFWDWSYEQVVPLRHENTFVHRFEVTQRSRQRVVTIFQSDPAEIGIQTWLDDNLALGGVPLSLRQIFVLSRIDHKMGDSPYMKDLVRFPSVRVVACKYVGRDIRHRVSLGGLGTPIKFLEELEPLGELSPLDMDSAAKAINRVIGPDLRSGGDGGALMAGMTHGGLQAVLWLNSVEVDMENLLEEILTDAAQAYFSVWRQRAEWWRQPDNIQASGGQVTGLALRVGGGGWFWVGIMAMLTAMPLVALFRLAQLVGWDPSEGSLQSDSSSEDGLSEDENQAMFIMQGAPKYECPPAYSDES